MNAHFGYHKLIETLVILLMTMLVHISVLMTTLMILVRVMLKIYGDVKGVTSFARIQQTQSKWERKVCEGARLKGTLIISFLLIFLRVQCEYET